MPCNLELHGDPNLQHDDPQVRPVHHGRAVQRADAVLLAGRPVRRVRWQRQLRDEPCLRREHAHVRARLHDELPVRGEPRRSDAGLRHDDDALRPVPDLHRLHGQWHGHGHGQWIHPPVRHNDEHLRAVPDELAVSRGRRDLRCESHMHVSHSRPETLRCPGDTGGVVSPRLSRGDP